MAFGGAPKPPAAQPITPVPQEDDPKGVEAQRRAAIAAKTREGYTAHLLDKGTSTDTRMGSESDPMRPRRSNLIG